MSSIIYANDLSDLMSKMHLTSTYTNHSANYRTVSEEKIITDNLTGEMVKIICEHKIDQNGLKISGSDTITSRQVITAPKPTFRQEIEILEDSNGQRTEQTVLYQVNPNTGIKILRSRRVIAERILEPPRIQTIYTVSPPLTLASRSVPYHSRAAGGQGLCGAKNTSKDGYCTQAAVEEYGGRCGHHRVTRRSDNRFRVRCQGRTKNGTQCTFSAGPRGGQFCEKHKNQY